MNKKHLAILIGIIVILSLALAACGGSSSSSSTAPTGDATAGKTAYASLPCAGCHGENAEGGVGPKLAGMQESWDRFQSTVRNGREEMPKFGTDVVSDQQLADVYAWLTSTK
jgi:mono/diheme cytochrome c family protein